jgi:hypothetical protein
MTAFSEEVFLGLWLISFSIDTNAAVPAWVGSLRESIAISCTVVMVFPSSGTLTFLLLDKEPVRCQKGTLSGTTAVSLSEVEERPTARAASFSVEADVSFNPTPTGLFAAGQSWYFEGWLRVARDGLFASEPDGRAEVSLEAVCKSFSERLRRGRW